MVDAVLALTFGRHRLEGTKYNFGHSSDAAQSKGFCHEWRGKVLHRIDRYGCCRPGHSYCCARGPRLRPLNSAPRRQFIGSPLPLPRGRPCHRGLQSEPGRTRRNGTPRLPLGLKDRRRGCGGELVRGSRGR